MQVPRRGAFAASGRNVMTNANRRIEVAAIPFIHMATSTQDGGDDDKLKRAVSLLREHAETNGDDAARDIARLIELGEYESREKQAGEWLRGVQHDSHEWRLDVIGGDITPLSQSAHTAVEAGELLDLLVKDQTYAPGEWAGDDELEVMREAGDVIVSVLGVMSLLKLDAVECVEAALDKNGSRDWADHKREDNSVSARAANKVASDLGVVDDD